MELKKKSWSDITIADYMELQEIVKMEDAVDVEVGIVSLLCGVDEEQILSLPIPEYQRLRKECQFIANFPETKGKAPKSVTINGNKYDVITDVSKLTTGQYIDFQAYLKQDSLEKYLPNILTIFIIPKGCKYGDDDYSIDDLAKDIEEYLPAVMAFEMCGFFLRAFLNSINVTLTYLTSKTKKWMRKAKTKEEKEKIQEIVEKMQKIPFKVNGDGFLQ